MVELCRTPVRAPADDPRQIEVPRAAHLAGGRAAGAGQGPRRLPASPSREAARVADCWCGEGRHARGESTYSRLLGSREHNQGKSAYFSPEFGCRWCAARLSGRPWLELDRRGSRCGEFPQLSLGMLPQIASCSRLGYSRSCPRRPRILRPKLAPSSRRSSALLPSRAMPCPARFPNSAKSALGICRLGSKHSYSAPAVQLSDKARMQLSY